jgi:hypothetical protein
LPGAPDAVLAKFDTTLGPSNITYYEYSRRRYIPYHPRGILLPGSVPAVGSSSPLRSPSRVALTLAPIWSCPALARGDARLRLARRVDRGPGARRPRTARRARGDGLWLTNRQPTNNHAERALHGAVIYRKLSLGSQSEQGEQRTTRLLSAHITCRLQRRSLFVYLTDALTAHAPGDPTPSLA